MGLFRNERYPEAERLARQGLYLPTGLGISEVEIDQVSAAVRESLSQATLVLDQSNVMDGCPEKRAL
jgi:dTDP-4-amino-4,6-dideoxygalactose transaminase